MKYLIINADDFGYNTEQTKAITELYTAGLITSTSLMAVAHDRDNALKIAKENNIPLGVHLTINSDNENNRWQSVSGVKSLSDEKGLYTKSKDITFKARRKDVKIELVAQYDYIKNSGCEIDHADNHCGTLYGINGRRFYIDAFDFCNEHHLPYRFPKCPNFLKRQLGVEKLPKPLVMAFNHIVNEGKKRNVKMLDDLITNPWAMNKIPTYDVLRDYYLNCLDNLVDGITEMFLHPSYPIDNDPEWTKRVYELKLLQSGDLLQKAKDNNIQVVSWEVFEDIKAND